jgi:two-component system KDP operon response regulator KdpE
MNKLQILVVEDDVPVRNLISTTLKAHSYKYITAENGQEAVMQASACNPDIILLDLGLPDIDGVEVIKKIRSWSNVPIIVISARSEDNDKIEALDNGADDYLTKPFSPAELLARIRTALRHAKRRAETGSGNGNGVFVCGDLKIDFSRHRIFLSGETVHLTQNEYRILEVLARNAGKVLTYDYMIRQVWGPTAANDPQILRVNMANIRRKIESNPAEPAYIRTEIGVGYWMTEGEEQ